MDSNDLLPAGLMVHGSAGEIAADFAAVALLQPVAATTGGVVCAPRAAPELARAGRARVTLPVTALDSPPGWPDPPSRTVGRWFIRSPLHIPAPLGYDGLVQVPGEGFGAWPHPTTLLCLEALDGLGDGAALDLGCGSGLLSQAWAMRHGPVFAVDLDPRAIAHTRASLAHAGCAHTVTLHHASIARTLPDATAPVVLANVPPVVHEEIARTMSPAVRTLLVSGVREDAGTPTLAGYGALGFRLRGISAAGGWGCWRLARA